MPCWTTGKAYKNWLICGVCLFLKPVVLDSNAASQHFQLLRPLLLPSSWLIPEPLTIPILLLPRPPPPPAFIAAFLLTQPSGDLLLSRLLAPHPPPPLSFCKDLCPGPQDEACSPQSLPCRAGPGAVARVSPCRSPALCVPGTMNNEELGVHGTWPAPRRLWLGGRRGTRSRWGGIPPTSDAIRIHGIPAPNRLLALQRGGVGPPCQNSCKIFFYTDKTHILLQPRSQKSLNHFSWNFPKKVSLRLTPCKGYFSQNSLSLAKL